MGCQGSSSVAVVAPSSAVGCAAAASSASSDARPLLRNPNGDPVISFDEDGERICSVCLGPLLIATTFTLPACGHTCHALCLATVMQLSNLCPICRVPVDRSSLEALSNELQVNSKSSGAALLAAELSDKDTRRAVAGPGSAAESSVEALVDELQSAAEGGGGLSMAMSLLEGSTPVEVRLAAVQALHALALRARRVNPEANPRGFEALLLVCSHERDDEVRCAAMRAAKGLSTRGSIPTLQAVAAALEDRHASSDVRTLAVDILQATALYDQEESKRTALLALSDEDVSVRGTAKNVLLSVCRKGDADFLKQLGGMATGHSSEGVRAAALDVVANIAGVSGGYGLHVLLAALRDTSLEVRLEALAGLRKLSPEDSDKVVRHVSGLLGPEAGVDAEFRVLLLNSLREFARRGDAAALGAALASLADSEVAVRDAAVAALRELGVRGDSQLAVQVAQLADTSADADIQLTAVQALGAVATSDCAEVWQVLQRLAAGDGHLAYEAAQALARIDKPAVV